MSVFLVITKQPLSSFNDTTSLGKGCIVNVQAAMPPVLKLLKESYLQNPKLLEITPEAVAFLMKRAAQNFYNN